MVHCIYLAQGARGWGFVFAAKLLSKQGDPTVSLRAEYQRGGRWTGLSRQGWARLYYNVSLIECESKEILDELLNLLGLDRFVVARLSDRAVLVDGQQRAAIARALARRGHPYRITDLPPLAPMRS